MTNFSITTFNTRYNLLISGQEKTHKNKQLFFFNKVNHSLFKYHSLYEINLIYLTAIVSTKKKVQKNLQKIHFTTWCNRARDVSFMYTYILPQQNINYQITLYSLLNMVGGLCLSRE